MRLIRLLVIAIASFFGTIIGEGLVRRAIALLMCGVLSFNSTTCYGYFRNHDQVNANLIANIGKKIPLGNLVSNLVILDYSRDNETQSDIIGTRALAAAGYAADGLRNLFVTLKQQQGRGGVPEFLQTHPLPDSRVRYLEALITRNGYNRYAFEGVKKHAEIKQRLQEIF